MIEVLQPGHFVAAAAGLGVVYAVYRIAKSNREILKSVNDLKNRIEPRLGTLEASVTMEVSARMGSESRLAEQIKDLTAAEMKRQFPSLDRSGRTPEQARERVTAVPGNRSSSSRSSSSETPLSSPLHPANPLNPIYADDTPSRSSSSSHSSHDSGCSSRSSSSYSGGSSSSGSYDSGSSSSDSGSCSSSD